MKRNRDAEMYVLLAMSLILLAGMSVMVVFWYRFATEVEDSQSWPSTAGRVLATEVKLSEVESCSGSGWGETCTTTTNYCPRVSYQYVAGDRPYVGDRLALGGSCFGSRAEAEELLERYPAGAEVEVYYDLDDPSRAILVREVVPSLPGWVVGLMWFGVIVSLGVCLGSVVAIVRRRAFRGGS